MFVICYDKNYHAMHHYYQQTFICMRKIFSLKLTFYNKHTALLCIASLLLTMCVAVSSVHQPIKPGILVLIPIVSFASTTATSFGSVRLHICRVVYTTYVPTYRQYRYSLILIAHNLVLLGNMVRSHHNYFE